MTNKITQSDIAIYQGEDGQFSFNVNVFDDTVWLTQKQMADLFDKSVKTINEHITNSFNDDEVEKTSTIRKFQIVQKEGSRDISRAVEHYNLNVIISVGYKVKSKRGVQFRKWATNILKQYMLNGYAVNDIRIKQIESSITELVASNKIQEEEITEIKNLLKRLIDRPIIIQNHHQINNNVSLGSKDLETKITHLIDKLIEDLKDNKKAYSVNVIFSIFFSERLRILSRNLTSILNNRSLPENISTGVDILPLFLEFSSFRYLT